MDWFPVVMRYTGVGIAIYATARFQSDRPSLYVLAAGMMSGEYVFRWARSAVERRTEEEDIRPKGNGVGNGKGS